MTVHSGTGLAVDRQRALLGLLPLLGAYGIRYYYVARPPTTVELLGSGDGMLIAVAWCAAAFVELLDAPARPKAKFWTGVLAITLLFTGPWRMGA